MARNRSSAEKVMMLPPGHDAGAMRDEACVFVEVSKGNDCYE